MEERSLLFLLFLAVTLAVFSLTVVVAVEPYGANYTLIDSESADDDFPQSDGAIAGNVTELDITGYATTQSWQGYFGNVSGTIQLADINDNVMYNWSLASPEGEVYASMNSSVFWTRIGCYIMANHTVAETYFNISTDDVDGVNETFSTGNGHDNFYTSNTQFATGTCPSTQMFDDTYQGVDNHFEEVLLTDFTEADQLVFVALLEEPDTAGFDQQYHDFQMIVLENGHGTDIAATNYYFYVELE